MPTLLLTQTSRVTAHLSRHALPLLLGIAMTLTLRGYQFGGGNHTVYLIAPLREVDPTLLANDWWTTHTLQYHVVYTKLAAGLMRLGIIEPAFLLFYLVLALLLHAAWLRIVLALGLDARTYVLSALLYYLSAAGTGLGSYQFLQDSSFLPGNVANVAMLWGIAAWIERRPWAAAWALGIAGLFHLNHALVGLLFWPIGSLFQKSPSRAKTIGGLGLILLLSLPNLIPAVQTTLAHVPKMPLKDFVDLYVHLRHPHHYDPLSWPAALWVSFLWPMPIALFAYLKRQGENAWSRAALIFSFFMALQLVALILAGILFVSEPLIQMSLFRFSIYPKLLGCVGAAAFLLDPAVMRRRTVVTLLTAIPIAAVAVMAWLRLASPSSSAGQFVVTNLRALAAFLAVLAATVAYACANGRTTNRLIAIALLALTVLFHNWLGLRINLQDDSNAAYLQVCAWAREHTPVDALFVVPPNEQLFRFHARRAIVVNFKNVPQLSSEMREWKERLEAVLDRPLSTLPRRFDLAHAAIAAQYDQLPWPQRIGVARRYGARFLLTAQPQAGKIPVFENASFHLYDLNNPADRE